MKSTVVMTILAAAVMAVGGCGGGGGGGGGGFPLLSAGTGAPATPATAEAPAPVITQMTGLAATGAPVANANVIAHCATGATLSGTTDANGVWSLAVTGQSYPCVVTVSGGSLPAGRSLHSIARDGSHTNVTPLTDLIFANAAGAALAALTDGDAAALAATTAKLDAAQVNVYASLLASGYPTVAALTDPLRASFQPQAGDLHDDTIALLTRSIDDSATGYDALVASVAAGGDGATPVPRTYVMTNAQVAAMPKLNKSSMSTTGGVLSMTLGAGLNPVGAFVGGGAGNKAVLQLPGLTGTRVADFKSMSLELQADNAVGVGFFPAGPAKPYVYVNLMIDLQCDATPLPANATIAQVQARRRFLIFDPLYKFIQQDNAISTTEFSTIRFTPSTGGWRASAGVPLGSQVALSSNPYLGTETLDTFDFATYPNACVTEGISADGGMYRDAAADPACNTAAGLPGSAPAICGKAHSGAIVVLGTSSTDVAVNWQVKKVGFSAFNPRTFRFD